MIKRHLPRWFLLPFPVPFQSSFARQRKPFDFLKNLCLVVCVLEFHISALQDIFFRVQHLSLNVVYVRFVYITACISSSHLIVAEDYSITWINYNLCVNLLLMGIWKFLHIMSLKSLEVFWQGSVFISFGYIPNSGIWGSTGRNNVDFIKKTASFFFQKYHLTSTSKVQEL